MRAGSGRWPALSVMTTDNRVENVGDHDHVKYWVNSKLVNEATDLNATKGKLIFQTEDAELYCRSILLAPLK
jgi:hypothetical protein